MSIEFLIPLAIVLFVIWLYRVVWDIPFPWSVRVRKKGGGD